MECPHFAVQQRAAAVWVPVGGMPAAEPRPSKRSGSFGAVSGYAAAAFAQVAVW